MCAGKYCNFVAGAILNALICVGKMWCGCKGNLVIDTVQQQLAFEGLSGWILVSF